VQVGQQDCDRNNQMENTSKFLLKLSHNLFQDTTQQQAFLEALLHPKAFSPCILWTQTRPDEIPFTPESPVKWQTSFVDRLAIGEKPGQHPLHQKGFFYCLDFSSVFAISVLQTITQSVNFVLDMCASPGGKSIFAWRALQPDLLISNEVIGKRIGALVSNFKRCQIKPAIAFSFDSKILAAEIQKSVDVVIVDAPCTGQSLIAKGNKAPGCFHPITINKNANRQKRILANSAQLVIPKGYLAYMTCAYSIEENEQVCEWFLKRFPQFKPTVVSHLAPYQSHLTALPCYRMFPQEGLGAGAFTMLLQNQEEGDRQPLPTEFLERSPLIFE
jgi:16S rRNA C967 or C1407 C5-methylase (RsmB/RsmF family)